MHHHSIQTLAIEMFKIHNGFSKVSFPEFFHFYNKNNSYSLRSQSDFRITRINTTLKGTEPARYFGPVIWSNIPMEIRSIKNFETFKRKPENGSRETVHLDYENLCKRFRFYKY